MRKTRGIGPQSPKRMIIPNNYEINEMQFDSTPRHCQLPARLENYVMGHDNDSSNEETINFALFVDCEIVIFE
ncbi:hypothetical protein CR513_34364, partial [Mucuna pruriens]